MGGNAFEEVGDVEGGRHESGPLLRGGLGNDDPVGARPCRTEADPGHRGAARNRAEQLRWLWLATVSSVIEIADQQSRGRGHPTGGQDDRQYDPERAKVHGDGHLEWLPR